jgi:hypothetical protein
MNWDRLLRIEERKHPASQHSVNSPSLTTLLTNNGNGSFAVCLYSCSIEKSKPGHVMNKAAAGRGRVWSSGYDSKDIQSKDNCQL